MHRRHSGLFRLHQLLHISGGVSYQVLLVIAVGVDEIRTRAAVVGQRHPAGPAAVCLLHRLVPPQVILTVVLAPGGEPHPAQITAARQRYVQIPPVSGHGGLHLRPGNLLHISGGMGHQILLAIAVGMNEIGAGGVVAAQEHGICPAAVRLLPANTY